MTKKSSEIRTLQKSSGKYYRVSLPKKFAKGLEKKYGDLESFGITMEGDYMVIRPQSDNFYPKGEFEFGEEELNSLESFNSEGELEFSLIEKYVSKILSAFIMSGAREIAVEVAERGKDVDDRKAIEFKIEEALKSQRFGRDVRYHIGENKVQISEGRNSGLDSYIDEVQNFVDANLLRNLENHRGGFDRWPSEEESSQDEELLDRLWSLSTRQSSQHFLELNRSQYPKALVINHVGKYLESVTDITKRIFDSFRYLEKEDEYDDQLVYILEDRLFDVLSEEIRYDKQLRRASENSYNLETRPKDYLDELKLYDKRINKLDGIRDFQDDVWDVNLDDFFGDQKELFKFGSKAGSICTLTERLVRFPRSITLAGFTGKTVDDIYDLSPEDR